MSKVVNKSKFGTCASLECPQVNWMMAEIDHEIWVTGLDREACSVVMHAKREFINRPVMDTDPMPKG